MSSARNAAMMTAPRLLEESIALLRHAPGALIAYYVGAVPFWLGFLYFFSDMSQSAYAVERLVGSALVMAILYIWLKSWQAVYAASLRATLLMELEQGWTAARIARLVMTQAAWQPWGLIFRPIALLVTLPFVWVSNFFQNITVLGDGRIAANGHSVGRRAWRQARLWPAQAHLLVFMLALFGLFVWLNVVSAIATLPSLLKTLLDVETAASRNMSSLMLNTTFLSASFAVAMLCLDPLWKAAYVLRCFYGESLRTGEDLLVELRKLERPTRSAVAAVIAGLLLILPMTNAQAQAVTPDTPVVTERAVELEQSIKQVLQEREYAWRMPRQEVEKSDDSFISRTIKDLKKKISDTTERVRNWFRRLFKEKEPKEAGSKSSIPVQQITYILIALGVLLLAWAVWTVLRRQSTPVVIAEATEAVPDLNAEDVIADQLPVDGWMRMMQDLLNAGELRLAMRAAYLATLAHLGQRELVAIARYKSNRDYQRELQRRARSREALLAAFEENLRAFEASWYGRHEVTRDLLARFTKNMETIRAC